MTYLLSHLWLLYLLVLLLAAIEYAVIGKPSFDAASCLYAAMFAAVPELIAVSGIYFCQRGNMLPAFLIAGLCCLTFAAAVWLFRAESKYRAYPHLPARAAGIASLLLCVLSVILCGISCAGDLTQIIVTACCLCGMIGAAYITGYLTAFGSGMGKP